MRISDWSSDVCSSDLAGDADAAAQGVARGEGALGWRGELRQGLPEAVAAQEERQDDAEAGEVAEEGDLQWRNCAAGQLRQHEHEGDEKGAEGDPAHRLREIARHGTQRLGGDRKSTRLNSSH